MMEEEFRALVAGVVAAPVNFGAHPQGASFPAIVLNLVSGFEGIHMNGTGPFEGVVQADCYADTYRAAKVLSREVVQALHTYRQGGFLMISHSSTRDSREGGTNEVERPYRTSLDFNVTWRPE